MSRSDGQAAMSGDGPMSDAGTDGQGGAAGDGAAATCGDFAACLGGCVQALNPLCLPGCCTGLSADGCMRLQALGTCAISHCALDALSPVRFPLCLARHCRTEFLACGGVPDPL